MKVKTVNIDVDVEQVIRNAKLDGNNIVSKFHYANNQVEFNGQKMTVEEFVGFLMSKFSAPAVVQEP